MIARYSLPRLKAIWSDEGRLAAWLEVEGIRSTHDARGTAESVTAIAQGNDHIGVAVLTTLSEPARAWWAPVETVSNSEGGFERIYQGAGLLLSWPLSLTPGATRTMTVSSAVTTTHDRAAEEPASVAPSEAT